MKTFTYYKCKSVAKKIGVLGLTALMIASCGSDNDNKTNTATNGVTNVPVGTSPIFGNPNTGIGSQDLSTWNNLKNQTNCQQGRMEDLTFTVTGSQGYYGGGYSSSVSGTLQQGQATGTSQGSFYGKSGQGDLIFVSRVSTGSNQLSYNVVLSYCIYQDYVAQYIGPNAGMQNFIVQNMQLTQSNSCASGNVTSAVVGFISPNYSQQQYVPIQYGPVSNGYQCY
jgi:hypothetical protein